MYIHIHPQCDTIVLQSFINSHHLTEALSNTLSHTRTVVKGCCKGDDASQWENGKFDPPATPKQP